MATYNFVSNIESRIASVLLNKAVRLKIKKEIIPPTQAHDPFE